MASLKRWLWRKGVSPKALEPPKLADIASEDLYFVPPDVNLDYVPTFGFATFVNREHKAWSTWPLTSDRIIDHPVIFGWLRRADALKLYEMAAMCQGDILELGTHQGLSSHIMAQALVAFGDTGKRKIHTLDLDEPCVARARENLAGEITQGLVDVQVAEAGETCRRYIAQGKKFGFVFVDHSHYYGPMREVCGLLDRLVESGGFVLFHDFTDPRSAFPEEGKREPDFGVLAACVHALPDREFEYFGAFGCAGLYRKKPKPTSWLVRLGRPVAAFGLAFLFFVYTTSPLITTTSKSLNFSLGLFGFVGLVANAIATVFLIRTWWSALLGVLLCLLSLFAAAFLSLGLMFLAAAEFRPIQEVQLQSSTVRAYRMDAGAISGIDLYLRQEIKLVPGLLIVRPITLFYRCSDFLIEATGANRIRITDPKKQCAAYNRADGRPRPIEFELNRFLYF